MGIVVVEVIVKAVIVLVVTVTEEIMVLIIFERIRSRKFFFNFTNYDFIRY